MNKEGEDQSKEVLTVGKKDKNESLEKEERKEKEWEDRDRDRGPPPPPRQEYYPPPPPPQPSEPMFTAKSLHKVMGIGLLIGVIILFVGVMLTVGGSFIKTEKEADFDLQRNLYASGHLIGGIGLFLTGIFIILPLIIIKDLSDKQKIMLIIIMAAIIIGFTLLI